MPKTMNRMQSNKLAGAKPGVAAQKYLDIAEIKDDTVIMRDGTLRAILLVSSINFALKSLDEQNAIVQAYMGFLNALDFPLQIIIQSRRMNIDGYLKQLHDRELEIGNELLKKQIRDYRDFIKQMVQLGDIMQKRFLVVIPLNPATDKRKNFFQRLAEVLAPSSAVHISDERFQKQKFDLGLRVNQIRSGLSSMSLNAEPLDTQSLIELYYNAYNPELMQNQPLTNLNDLQIES